MFIRLPTATVHRIHGRGQLLCQVIRWKQWGRSTIVTTWLTLFVCIHVRCISLSCYISFIAIITTWCRLLWCMCCIACCVVLLFMTIAITICLCSLCKLLRVIFICRHIIIIVRNRGRVQRCKMGCFTLLLCQHVYLMRCELFILHGSQYPHHHHSLTHRDKLTRQLCLLCLNSRYTLLQRQLIVEDL